MAQYPEHLATGTGAKRYASLDRFGRAINKLWDKAGTPLLQYSFDQSSNRTFRKDLAARFATTLYAFGSQ